MASTMKFELVSPEKVLLSADAEQIILTAADGQMTVLPGHAPVVAALQPGVIDVSTGGKTRRMYVGGGFAEIDPNHLTVLAERAFDVADLKGPALEREVQAAEEALAAASTDEARLVAETALGSLRNLA